MKVLLGKKKDGKSATPSTTSSANSSTHNNVSTNASSTTQVGSTASLHGGSGSGSERNKLRIPKSHDVSTNSSSTVVGSSSNSTGGGKADSGNKSHREKDKHHGSDTSSSKAPVTKSRPELKASKSLLPNISLSRTKLDAEEKEKNRRLEEEHKRLETTKLGHFEYFKVREAAKSEQSRLQRAKDYLETLEENLDVLKYQLEKIKQKIQEDGLKGSKYELEETRRKSLEKAILATEEEKGKQESEVEFKRKIRNNADAELAKVHKQDDEIADEQSKILSQMSERNSYRVKVEKAMKKEDEERQQLKIKQDEEEKRANEARRQADQKRIANDEAIEDQKVRIRGELIKCKDSKFEKSKYDHSKMRTPERERERGKWKTILPNPE
ncbi:uncharacterized protein EAE97_002772 [Botrytis byssoidea]|uniref:Uncharacterized protein n=1 Tax=Botrytis byssoidea TaxID=139641 RepID=A0A9P5IYD0_9HELO|nr:uncharacterized protein EAE97_002772 [Botrytis byssoidea]KAF7951221.1 hypothetical protein EAE97_002772 [Botrytis byssoidea]